MKIQKKLLTVMAAFTLFTGLFPVTAGAAAAAEYIVTAPLSEENGVLTVENGEKWFKVKDFQDNKDYIITVQDPSGETVMLTAADDSRNEYIWHYFRETNVSSFSSRLSKLTAGPFRLICHNNELHTQTSWYINGDNVWEKWNGTLRHNEAGAYSYLTYDPGSDPPFGCTDDFSEAVQVDIYTNGDQLERCIGVQPAAESYVIEGSGYEAPKFSVSLSDPDITVEKVTWFVDQEEQSGAGLTFTADSLTDQPAGVHRVSCLVEAYDQDGVRYRERSAEAAFVIAKGVVPDSVMTFSDIHEEYDLIIDAIGSIIDRTGGYIPSLIVCTGDFINGSTPDTETALERYYPQMIPGLGGIDAVYVGGNHDPGAAAAIMSSASDLGAEEGHAANGGQIFRGLSDEAVMNGKSSRYARGVIVYGLNYDAVMVPGTPRMTYSYENVLNDLEAFLKKRAEDYHGELILISSHPSLHIMGIQPESIDSKGAPVKEWAGENAYSLDYSYEVAELLNRYAQEYDMDIMFLFGHNHSRNENEMLLTDGDELFSTKNYASRLYDSQPLSFTYGHAGYLSTKIGCADAKFSFISRSEGSFSYDLISLNNGSIRHTDVLAKSTFVDPEPETVDVPAAASEAETLPADEASADSVMTAKAAASETGTASGKPADSPSTGDKAPVLSFIIIAAAMTAAVRMRRPNEVDD